jgi:hypothetical protein
MKRQLTNALSLLVLLAGVGWLTPAQDNQEPPKQPALTLPEEPDAVIPEFQPRRERKSHRFFRKQIVSFGQDVTLGPDEVCQDMIVIGGNAEVKGTVEGDLVVIFGSAEVSGKLDQGLVVVMGSANLIDAATVERDAVVVGGRLRMNPKATINGDRHEIVLDGLLPNLHWMTDWFRHGFLLARPLPPQVHWAWVVAGMLLVFYFLLSVLFARPLTACVNAIETTPVGSFFAGMLALILLGPLMFLLVVSVAGILVVPVLLFALVAFLFFGKVVVYRATGQQLGKAMNLPGLQHPAVALLIGIIIFYLLYTVPVLGFVVWGIATVWGVGAVLMAIFSGLRREQEPPLVTMSSAALAGIQPAGFQESPPALPLSPDLVTLRRAGFWIRFWATLLDFVLLGTLVAFVGPVFLFLWAAYHIAMWTWKGTTVGGIVAGIKVIRADGRPINFSVALIRSLSSFFSAVVFFIGFFWAGWTRDKQAWHDKIAGTIVVKVPKGISLV